MEYLSEAILTYKGIRNPFGFLYLEIQGGIFQALIWS